MASKGFKGDVDPEDFMDMLEDRVDRKQIIKEIRQKSNDPGMKLMNLLRNGINLINQMTGNNVTDFDDKNLKVFSPKFLSIFPEEKTDSQEDTIDFFSPSLFSLHSEGDDFEKKYSIPNLIQSFTAADQEEWLNLIFEAAGVQEAISEASDKIEEALYEQNLKDQYEEEIEHNYEGKKKKGFKSNATDEYKGKDKLYDGQLKKYYEKEIREIYEMDVDEKKKEKIKNYAEKMRNKNGEPLYFTKEKAVGLYGKKMEESINIFEFLAKNYTKDQMKEYNETGFAILTKEQLELVYGKDSPYHNPVMIEKYANMTPEEVNKQLIEEIHLLAESKEFQKKQQDIVLSPIILGNIIFDSAAVSQPLVSTK